MRYRTHVVTVSGQHLYSAPGVEMSEKECREQLDVFREQFERQFERKGDAGRIFLETEDGWIMLSLNRIVSIEAELVHEGVPMEFKRFGS